MSLSHSDMLLLTRSYWLASIRDENDVETLLRRGSFDTSCFDGVIPRIHFSDEFLIRNLKYLGVEAVCLLMYSQYFGPTALESAAIYFPCPDIWDTIAWVRSMQDEDDEQEDCHDKQI